MARKRKVYSSQFKSKLAVAALQERSTLSELAAKHEVHPNQISTWKQQLLSGASEFFDKKRGRKPQDDQELIDRLYRQIGKLQVELDWVKKKAELS